MKLDMGSHRSNQFQKGRSGNPKVRPKKNKNIYGLIKKVFEERVTVKGPGRTRSMTKLEAALVQLANKAANGDIKALREVIRLREKLQEQEPLLTPGPTFVVEFIHPRLKNLSHQRMRKRIGGSGIHMQSHFQTTFEKSNPKGGSPEEVANHFASS
jgi:hypothetical protein